MSAVREFPSVSVSNNNNVIQINTNDSNFSVVPGSVIFIAGDRPRVVISGDTVNRTLTLSIAYIGDDIVEKSATLIPLGQNDALLSAITSLTQAQNGLAEAYGDGPGNVSEVSWSVIIDPPPTSTQWPTWTQVQGDISEVLPETATRFPNFSEVGGKVAEEQLPESVTKDKRTVALGLPVKTEASLTHRLIDYPKLKKTETVPTESPNNRREMLFDDIRNEVHIALTASWFSIPTAISHRKFMVKITNRYLQFNNAYTGNITMRVYPLGGGGNGLPNNPSLSNNQWHTITEAVTDLSQLARDFEGIIDYVELDGRWHTFDSDQSHFPSIDAYYASGSGTAVSPFRDFYLRKEGNSYYWYSDDITPETPHSMGSSWSQDATNKKLFFVNGAVGSSDALRFFSDNYDSYELELIVKSDVDNNYALTVSNSDPNIVYYPEIGRYVTNERLYFKRRNQAITGTVEVESIKMRLSHYG